MTEDGPTAAEVDRVAQLLAEQIGLRPEPSLRGRLCRGLRDEATAQGQDLAAYVDGLVPGDATFQRLVDRVTVQESSFFRHAEQFEVLARDILPTLTPPVALWSAGCANGQEPFSLAIVLQEGGVAGSVVATDLSTSALRRTAAARYRNREVDGLSPERRARHLTQVGAAWEVNPSVRERVTVFRHNLIDGVPDQVRACQVVFCRNVLIYLSPSHVRAFVDRLVDGLPRGAYLFLGASESIWQVSDRFETVRAGDVFFYRLPHARERVAPPPAPPPRPRQMGDRQDPKRRRPAPAAATRSTSPPEPPPPDVADVARQGQEAAAAGEHGIAVVAFRKWVYLAPDDALAHLHLGLALEARGDQAAAGRAFSTARRVLLAADPIHVEGAIEGYAATELLRLLDAKRKAVTP